MRASPGHLDYQYPCNCLLGKYLQNSIWTFSVFLIFVVFWFLFSLRLNLRPQLCVLDTFSTRELFPKSSHFFCYVEIELLLSCPSQPWTCKPSALVFSIPGFTHVHSWRHWHLSYLHYQEQCNKIHLEQWFLTFLMLWPFNVVPHVLVIPNHIYFIAIS